MADTETKISSNDIAILIKHAGLNLNQEEVENLRDALGYVVEKSSRVREGLTQTDEPAYVFHVVAEN